MLDLWTVLEHANLLGQVSNKQSDKACERDALVGGEQSYLSCETSALMGHQAIMGCIENQPRNKCTR